VIGKVIIGFTMSLNGFIHEQYGDVERLYPDLDTLRYVKPRQESVEKTSPVVMGRKTFAIGDADSSAGNYECQVPIFVEG
jgi:dihydrofolate reductase